MIEIDGKIVSLDILTCNFMCDLDRCKGICCVEGNAGAPLEAEEVDMLEREYEAYKPYMKPQGVAAIEREGFMVVDPDGDLTTPLIEGLECAYSFEEGGKTFCAVERAWQQGKTGFRKPVSCHLYPIRVTKFRNGMLGLNYHRWNICSGAVECGNKMQIPLYKALKEPLVRCFGEDFFDALSQAGKYVRENGLE